jgi:hypothetical protein
MAWTTPTTRTTGTLITASIWNTDLVDDLVALRGGGIAVTSQAANDVLYASSGTQLTRASNFTFDGTILTIPGQIKFPAAQAASTDANTLDDYEEGTWTPVLGGSGGTSGQTYSVQQGEYLKIGKWVFVEGRLVLTVLGTITTNAQIQGLPFTSKSGAFNGALSFAKFEGLTATACWMAAQVDSGATAGTIFHRTAGAANGTQSVQGTFSSATELVFVGFYEAAG